jgi:AcrR family transcriptional regulator
MNNFILQIVSIITMPKEKKKLDGTTEGKIKEAAHKLFTQKGFAATKTRDIAAEAGINLALLNYYFRSKEKLFEIIMLENMEQFIRGVALIMLDEHTSVQEKIEKLISMYIDMLLKEPDLPLFIINTLRNNPSKLLMKMDAEIGPARDFFEKQIKRETKSAGITPMNPFHVIANLIGLTIFPFVARPLLMRRANVDEREFYALMQERKKLIPKWLDAMQKVK